MDVTINRLCGYGERGQSFRVCSVANGRFTMTTGIRGFSPVRAIASAPAWLDGRFTNPSATCLPNRSLNTVLVIHPISLFSSVLENNFIPAASELPPGDKKPHNDLLRWPDIFIREITS